MSNFLVEKSVLLTSFGEIHYSYTLYEIRHIKFIVFLAPSRQSSRQFVFLICMLIVTRLVSVGLGDGIWRS